ncbi:SDR family oxidoreductase [Brucella sp. 21LCYQ03]|nr:SDR family oxidoreductase [Brucella sp. 21LCYQ03]
MRDFLGKSILITGGAGAIGSATAKLFLERGADVVLADIDEAKLESVGIQLSAFGKLSTIPADLADEAQVKKVIDYCTSTYGILDVVFNNAGIAGAVRPIHELSSTDWDHIVQVNLRSQFLVLKYAATHMVEQKTGSLVNMGSSMSDWDVLSGGAGYVATKHAVLGLTKAAALDLAPYGVRVNAVCPGVIETSLGVPGLEGDTVEETSPAARFASKIPSLRIGQPEDVGEVVVFLASDKARHINGAAWLIDGGQTLQSYANGPDNGHYGAKR